MLLFGVLPLLGSYLYLGKKGLWSKKLDVSIPRGYPGPKDVKGASTDTKGV